MKMINKAMRGVSFLLCLGFLLSVNEANAKTDIEDITRDEAYGNCANAQSAVSAYNAYGNCQTQQAAVTSAQDKLDSVCDVYNTIKAEYKKCTSGGMDASKHVSIALTNAQTALKQCQEGMATQLRNAKSALSQCKKDNSNADKASKKANSAQEKADKANAENEAAQKAAQEAEAAYDAAIATCKQNPNDAVCSRLKDLYNAYQNAAKKAGKKAKAATEANNKNATAQNNADSTALQVNQNSCSGGMVYSTTLRACTFSVDATAEEHAAFEKCGGPISECIIKAREDRVAAAKAAEARQAQQKLDQAKKAYDDCQFEKGSAECQAEAKAYQEALNRSGEYSCIEEGTCGYGLNTDSTGGIGDGDKAGTSTDIQKQVNAALAKPTCKEAKDNMSQSGGFGIFQYLACRITLIVADLRSIVYILAGFGMIAFAYSAIIGKINFKQLANIGIGLFILSMTTALIEEIVYNDGSTLQYGDFLPNGNHAQYFTSGSGGSSSYSSMSPQELEQMIQECSNNPNLCPDVNMADLKAAADGKGWSFMDGVDAIKNGLNIIRNTAVGVQSVKDYVEGTIDAAKAFSDAWNGTNDYVRAAQQDLNTANEILNQAQANVAEKQAALDAAQRERDNLIDEAQKGVDEAKKQRDALVKEQQDKLDAAKKEAEEKLAAVNQAQENIDNLQAQRAQHAKELEDMNKYLKKDDLLDAAKAKDDEVARLQEQINQLDPNRPAEAAQIAKLKEQMAQAEADAKQYRQEYQDLTNKYGNKTEEEIRADMENLRKDITDDEYLLSQANQALNTAKADYNNANNAVTQAQYALDRATREGDNLVNQAQYALDQATREGDNLVAQAERDLAYARSGEESAQAVVDQAEANYKAAKDGASDFFSNVTDATTALATMVGNTAVEANILAGAGSAISNNVQDMGSSRAQEAYRGVLNQTYEELLKKCSTSVCSENEKNALANLEQQVKSEQTGFNNWMNNDGKGGGSTILTGMEKVAEAAAGASNTAAMAEAGRNEGEGLGGMLGLGDGAQAMGTLFGVLTGVTEGYDEARYQQSSGNFDFQSNENKRNQISAAAQQACAAQGGVFDEISGKCTDTKKTEEGKK